MQGYFCSKSTRRYKTIKKGANRGAQAYTCPQSETQGGLVSISKILRANYIQDFGHLWGSPVEPRRRASLCMLSLARQGMLRAISKSNIETRESMNAGNMISTERANFLFNGRLSTLSLLSVYHPCSVSPLCYHASLSLAATLHGCIHTSLDAHHQVFYFS